MSPGSSVARISFLDPGRFDFYTFPTNLCLY